MTPIKRSASGRAHAFGLILTVDLPDVKSDHHRDRMNWQGRKQFMDELVPLFLSLRCVGTGCAVGKFDQCDDGDGDVGISGRAAHGGEHLPCAWLAMAQLWRYSFRLVRPRFGHLDTFGKIFVGLRVRFCRVKVKNP